MKVLLLEDEQKINNMLTLFITQEGHQVSAHTNAENALDAFKKDRYDLVISDLMLQGMQGETFIQNIREISDVYIIVLTAKTHNDSKIALLKEGADDYITKPFSIEEITVKLSNIEKRLKDESMLKRRHNDTLIVMTTKTKRASVNGEPIDLSFSESIILEYLMNHPNQVLSRDQILTHCLSGSEAYDRIVDTYIKNIRLKLGDKTIIESVYGQGYRLRGE